MILLSDISNRMRQIGLDAEGSDRYLDSIDIIPSINSAIEWLVGIISSRIGVDKFVEEKLSDLHMTKIWQTNRFSRLSFDSANEGFTIWTVTGVLPKPNVYVSLGSKTMLPGKYRAEIMQYLNRTYENHPLVGYHFATGLQLKPHESTFRPELTFQKGRFAATKLTHEQITEHHHNPFVAGYSHNEEFITYGYIPLMDYSNERVNKAGEGSYSGLKEIHIVPDIPKTLVAVSFIRHPETIPQDADINTYEVPFPASMLNLIVQKSLNYIAIKQGDNTTIFNVSIQEVLQQLQ